MKTKLKFLGNIILLAIFDAGIVLNIIEINSKGLQISALENIILLLTCLVAGLVILRETYESGQQLIFERRCAQANYDDLYDEDESEEW